METAAILMPAFAAAGGVGLVRHGWGGRRVAAVAGWALVAAAIVALGVASGAWGMAVASCAAIIAALVVLMVEGWRTPRGRTAAIRNAPAVTLPRPTLRSMGRRLAVFLLVVPGGGAATVMLAFGVQVAARRLGWAEADTTVLALALQPTAWTLLVCVQMTRASAAAMAGPVLACATAGLLLWWPL